MVTLAGFTPPPLQILLDPKQLQLESTCVSRSNPPRLLKSPGCWTTSPTLDGDCLGRTKVKEELLTLVRNGKRVKERLDFGRNYV
jgi:hypothetical protein